MSQYMHKLSASPELINLDNLNIVHEATENWPEIVSLDKMVQ